MGKTIASPSLGQNKLDVNQGVGNAGKILKVTNSGTVEPYLEDVRIEIRNGAICYVYNETEIQTEGE